MRGSQEILAFNRGVVSRLALARLDLAKLRFSAEEQTNWMPRALGSMMLRPGLGYIGSVAGQERMLEFVFSSQDTALIEMSEGLMRVWRNDALVSRAASASTIANGTFNTDLSSWTDQDQSGGVSVWVAGGYMGLTGNGSNYAIRQQLVSAVAGSHTLRIVINNGPVVLRVGSTSLGSEYLRDTALGTGTHSIVVPTTGSFYLQFRSRLLRQVLVDSVSIEAAGVLTLPTPYAAADLQYLRFVQSGDVIYLACKDLQQRKIERRSNGSWSIVLYRPEDGPFQVQNVTPTGISSSGLNGNVVLTATTDIFSSLHVGALFSLTSAGQRVETSFSTDNVFSSPIRITGVGETRRFSIVVTGTFNATLTLQQSIGDIGFWADVSSFIAPTSTTYADSLDNQIVYYRIGVKTAGYTSGTAETVLSISAGSITGVARVTSVLSTLVVLAEVLTPLGGTTATTNWAEGLWSDFRGWPTAVTLHDGRLWWAGKDRFVGSISDSFESFDIAFEGDAGPIIRSIGFGPVDSINWLLSLDRLTAGTDGAEIVCRSSALDEPLTPTNFTPKKAGTQGTAPLAAQEVDGSGIFVQRCLSKLYELSYGGSGREYAESDLSVFCPELCAAGIVGIKIQRQPDTRIHAWLADGSVAIMVFDRAEDLKCWVTFETDGQVEDVCILPGVAEDAVYYVVARTIGGTTVRYLERWALETEARGAVVNKVADAFVTGSGASITAAHLVGETVTLWADGADIGTQVVPVGGVVALGQSYTSICAGLSYEARFRSTKLAYVVPPGQSALNSKKRLTQLGLLLADTHSQGIQYGQSFDVMDDLPLIEDGAAVEAGSVWDEFDQPAFSVPGEWDTDARLCLRAASPRSATVLAAVITMASHS